MKFFDWSWLGLKLLLVEAPTKARHIQQFLGASWKVVATMGHVVELPLPNSMTEKQREKYGQYAQDIDNDFEPLFKVSRDKTKIVAEIKRLAAKADEIYIGTDPDIEGAAIGWHVLKLLKVNVPVYRVSWNEITKAAVENGIKNRELINEKKQEPAKFFGEAESALARAQWDRLFGFAASPLSWKLRRGTSAGRVQTPGTKLVVEREKRRLAFKTVDYYTIYGVFDGIQAELVEYKGKKIADGSKIDDNGVLQDGFHLITDADIKEIMKDLKTKKYQTGKISSKPYRRTPPPPFTTSSALQSIGSKTKMTAKQITSILQNLYQDSYTTYIRTVSIEAAPDAIKEARREIEKTFGKTLVPAKPRIYKNKKQDNSGHECIRNTLDDKTGKLVNVKLRDPKQQKVFDLIRLRFLASQSIDCEGTTWSTNFIANDKTAVFNASQTEIHEPGWTTIYELDEEVGA